MKVLAISGSLRRDSHNTTLLRAAAELLPPPVELEFFDGLKAVEPYDEDDDQGAGPDGASRLRDAIESADAILIATPEYNSS
ncbi:MAG: NAD(P)H-dependent oxidoreductase, partial [Solirubrobacterales bacterium]